MSAQSASTPPVVEERQVPVHRVTHHAALRDLLIRASTSGFRHEDDLLVVARAPGVWEATLTGPDIHANYGLWPDPHRMVAELITDPDEAFPFSLSGEGVYEAILVETFDGVDYRWDMRYQHSAQHGPLRIRVPKNG